eukprot:evm.model.scf_819.7 EVM.evm.TU.scf_819.7   scf_819:51890-56835(+)
MVPLPARSLGPTLLPAPLPRTLGPKLPALRRRQRARPAVRRAAEQDSGTATSPSQEDIDDCDYLVAGNYCSIDEQGKRRGKRSLGELEAEFLEALRAWYYDGEPVMTNEEFEILKEELVWQGSTVAVLSSAEQKFLEASMAYAAERPIMSDDEYDELKAELKQANSFVAMGGPRCSLRSRKMYSDLEVDYLRMLALNVPATVLVLGVLFTLDDLTGFGITKLIELPQPWGSIVVWGLVLPTLFVFSNALTNFVVRDGVILKGPCPNCGEENLAYFGSIFSVEGNRGTAEQKCPNCSSTLVLNERKREIMISAVAADK